jgi:hypothetical protein
MANSFAYNNKSFLKKAVYILHNQVKMGGDFG